ncbi:MAG: fructose-1,6-bisphosphatase [Bacteroidales bacterium]|nr:fructose-1,6-bisphosphatase [Fournierella massiliensis]MCF2557934.1 fructose-1,6-bisphosphatase [Fournierella massiliensis]MCI6739562.1 fructose-1,6-bisphosphatase [Bacteroidales bacterium]
MEFTQTELEYLRLLSESYGNIQEASTEIINLAAILNLPKGTEHFISDIHGEYASFTHILKNASGVIKLKIDETFGGYVSPEERSTLATLIYYPEEKLDLIKKQESDMTAFYQKTLHRLITLLSVVTVKYTRSYVRKQIPKEYSYIIEELLFGDTVAQAKGAYKEQIIATIIETGVADDFIVKMSELISRVSINRLHILGDVFDRGPGGDVVLETLMHYHSVDIQWGNHDILWMGAAAGNKACIANVIRICTRYDNLHTLEVGYGISLRPLLTFALSAYADDPCQNFKPVVTSDDALSSSDYTSLSKISKAIAIIQFKLEGQLIEKHPHYEMDSLRLLHKVDYQNATVEIDGKRYELNNKVFPTIDPADPYALTPMESAVMDRLQEAFLESKILQDHIRFLFSKGSIYKCYNNNLLFHGCMPLNEDGSFMPIMTAEGPMEGKPWFDYAERVVRQGYFGTPGSPEKERGVDFFWYLWCGYKSPLFGKKKITTFERCFIEDQATWKEAKNPYYTLMDRVDVVESIVAEFGLDPKTAHIINGHMPVNKGTNPVHADGRAIVIDGGFAKAYQKKTGIAGYSLIYNSQGFMLAAHEPFISKEMAIQQEVDIHSTPVAQEKFTSRILNKDTDLGGELKKKVEALKKLLYAYRTGLIPQRR